MLGWAGRKQSVPAQRPNLRGGCDPSAEAVEWGKEVSLRMMIVLHRSEMGGEASGALYPFLASQLP